MCLHQRRQKQSASRARLHSTHCVVCGPFGPGHDVPREAYPTIPASKDESGPPPYRLAMIQPGLMVAAPSVGILLLSAAFQCGCHMGLMPWGCPGPGQVSARWHTCSCDSSRGQTTTSSHVFGVAELADVESDGWHHHAHAVCLSVSRGARGARCRQLGLGHRRNGAKGRETTRGKPEPELPLTSNEIASNPRRVVAARRRLMVVAAKLDSEVRRCRG